MVYLNRITTKSGDDGTTGLGDGTRVRKTHARIAAIGSLDELNASIGVVLSTDDVPEPIAGVLRQVQNDLFDGGAEVCFPSRDEAGPPACDHVGITDAYVQRLQRQIDAATARLKPLNSFVLPGGTLLAARLHVARTVCRRAERDALTLAELEPVSRPLRQYLNRLSDLLFAMARLANDEGRGDVLWEPGRERESSVNE